MRGPGSSVLIPLDERMFERVFLEQSRLRVYDEPILHPGSSVSCLKRSHAVVPRSILIIQVFVMIACGIKPTRI